MDPLLLYLALVGGGGLVLILWVAYRLRKSEGIRKRQAMSRRLQQAVTTSSPIDNPTQEMKERAVASLEQRFTVTRRMVVPLIVVVVTILMSLPFLSMIPAATLSVVIAVITVGLGIASRPVIENAFAGLVISFSKLFRIGDTVVLDDQYGTIEDITITHTTMKIWDWRRYVVPNSQMLQSRLINYTLFDHHLWGHVEFWIAYDTDLDEVRELAIEAARQSKAFIPHEEPTFWAMEMGKEGIRCWVAAWTAGPSERWALTHDIRMILAREFRQRGIRAHSFRHDVGDERTFPPQATGVTAVRGTGGPGG